MPQLRHDGHTRSYTGAPVAKGKPSVGSAIAAMIVSCALCLVLLVIPFLFTPDEDGYDYSEARFQSFADIAYGELFGDGVGREDHILLVLSVDEDDEGYFVR